ncbi:polysaccharide deacetylase family protein [Gilvimarinus algae]|uniref:Polysaccharide deacetylase family protein n=1 Tax=Gilvimarinus algae TaxID=3058037 RepID=A0ABT8T913_9GAMM|nr:polysaccharide deacetylase family protein [Gilvimarinus sp. SDUM040014]MDO3380614.1 polysaccharide deacetylase family protein [Gilvimarinus sp. SDUM040014]
MRPFFRLSVGVALLGLSAFSHVCLAQDLWNGKRAAVSLTYDDSLNIHLDSVVPALNKHGFRGTFYVTIAPEPFAKRLNEWRAVAEQGHELGNHTLFHPCNGQGPGREWVSPDRDLSSWTVARMSAHIQAANTTLEALDGKTERTLAYPCGDTTAGGESYIEQIKPLFVGARGVVIGYPTPEQVNRYNIAAHMIHGQSGEQLTALVDEAIERGALVVFLFHGVGGEHNLNVSAEAHNRLLDYLSTHGDQLWVAPMVDIAQFLKAKE